MIKKVIVIISIFALFSCSKNENTNSNDVIINAGGVFITNEGNFSVANSSLSYYYPATNEVSNNIFYQVNDVPLGDVAQSIIINGDNIYLVINNSGLIYVLDNKTLKYKAKINNLLSPREIIIINNKKAYISDLYSTKISVVNLENFEISNKIEITKTSDCIVKHKDNVLIANWSAYNQTGVNNTIMVVNSQTDLLTDSIVVGIEPNSMVIDKDDNLWVLCSGGFMNNEKPTLWKINPNTFEVNTKFTFSNILNSPDNLCINGTLDSLYFINNDVYSMSINDLELPSNPVIEKDNKNFYSLGISPSENQIYLSDAIDYNQNGIVYRYDAKGNLISSFEVGIIPGCFAFN